MASNTELNVIKIKLFLLEIMIKMCTLVFKVWAKYVYKICFCRYT